MTEPREPDQTQRPTLLQQEGRWRLSNYRFTEDDNSARVDIALTTQDGETRDAMARGKNAPSAILTALFEATGYLVHLKTVRSVTAPAGGAQVHLVLSNEAGDASASIGRAASEEEAFLIAAIRIINGWEAAMYADVYCVRKTPHRFSWLTEASFTPYAAA